jgi:hypothetical protein
MPTLNYGRPKQRSVRAVVLPIVLVTIFIALLADFMYQPG